MKKNIIGANPFQVPTTSFAIGPSSSGFTLNYSADYNPANPTAANWKAHDEATPANEDVTIVTCPVVGMWFKLANNTDTVLLLIPEQ